LSSKGKKSIRVSANDVNLHVKEVGLTMSSSVTERKNVTFYRAFQRWGKQNPPTILINSKVVKIDPKIIISLHLTYYGTESARCFRERSPFVSMLPQLCGPAFCSMGMLEGAGCNQKLAKRVAHEDAADDREHSLPAKSRPKTMGGAYPDRYTHL